MDIRAAGKGGSLYNATYDVLTNYGTADRTMLVSAIHITAWILVVLFIVTESRIPHKKVETPT